MKKTLLRIALFFLIIISQTAQSQIIGGRSNSEQQPKVSEATKLSGGGFTGDVNHMTGEYNGTIPLGSVSTPSGLSYSLSLSYNSSFSFSSNQPMTAGIPYGDGWSPNIPTISVETEVFHRFATYLECGEETFNSQLSINGSINNPSGHPSDDVSPISDKAVLSETSDDIRSGNILLSWLTFSSTEEFNYYVSFASYNMNDISNIFKYLWENGPTNDDIKESAKENKKNVELNIPVE